MLASKDEVEPMSEETAQEFNKMLNKYRGGILKDIENYLKLNVMTKEEARFAKASSLDKNFYKIICVFVKNIVPLQKVRLFNNR